MYRSCDARFANSFVRSFAIVVHDGNFWCKQSVLWAAAAAAEQVVQRSFVLGQKAQQRTKNSNENKTEKQLIIY